MAGEFGGAPHQKGDVVSARALLHEKRSCINQQLTLIQFKKIAAQNDIAKTELGVDPQYSPGAYLQRQQ